MLAWTDTNFQIDLYGGWEQNGAVCSLRKKILVDLENYNDRKTSSYSN